MDFSPELADFYADVFIHVQDGSAGERVLKTHKYMLASRSSWFNKRFRSRPTTGECDFFFPAHSMIGQLVSVIYGKEISLQDSEVSKFKKFLVTMGVQWEEGAGAPPAETSTQTQRKRGSEDMAAPGPAKKIAIPALSPSPEKSPDKPASPTSMDKTTPAGKPVSPSSIEKISQFVEEITETGATELNKINHTLTRNPKSYCCTKCFVKSQYIHDAEMHNREHVKEQEKPWKEKILETDVARRRDESLLIKIATDLRDRATLENKNQYEQHLQGIRGRFQEYLKTVEDIRIQKITENITKKCETFVNYLRQNTDLLSSTMSVLNSK